MKTPLGIMMLLLALLLPSGCTTLKAMNESMKKAEADRVAKIAANSEDKYLSDKFYPLPKNVTFKYDVKLYTDSVQYVADPYRKTQGNVNDLRYQYVKDDSSRDQVASNYIAAVKARGNKVTLYKAPVNAAIERYINKRSQNGYSWVTDWDTAFIEFDNDGRMVSSLSRSQRISHPILGNIFQEQYVNILFGGAVRNIEMNVNNTFLEKNLITEIN